MEIKTNQKESEPLVIPIPVARRQNLSWKSLHFILLWVILLFFIVFGTWQTFKLKNARPQPKVSQVKEKRVEQNKIIFGITQPATGFPPELIIEPTAQVLKNGVIYTEDGKEITGAYRTYISKYNSDTASTLTKSTLEENKWEVLSDMFTNETTEIINSRKKVPEQNVKLNSSFTFTKMPNNKVQVDCIVAFKK